MTDKTPARPELPEPELGYIETDKSRQPAFSARQMREALQSAQPAAPGVTGAMQTLIETLKADPEYAWAWHCNVAMATFDEGLSHYAANKAAARFLSWLAQIDTTTHPGFPKAPAQPAAAVSDEAARLAEQLSNIANGVRICGVHDRHFVSNRLHEIARAILALRPQSESDARRAAQEQLYTERERHTAEVKRLQAEIGRLQSLRPQAVPMTDEQEALEEEEFSLLSQTQIAALLWVLWCHQGASSPVGQPIRFALGMDKRQAMSDEQVSAAQRFRIDWHQWSGITAPAGGEKQA